METLTWIVTGAIVGWIAFSLLRLNSERGMLMSLVLGAIGALIGGKAIAPLFIVAPLDPVSVTSFVFAAGAAAALLLLGNAVQNRWNI